MKYFSLKSLIVYTALSLLFFTQVQAQTRHDVTTVGSTAFSPSTLSIQVGDTVVWTNAGGTHNVNGTMATFPSNPVSFGGFSPTSGAPWPFSFVFTTPGTYSYRCDPHAGMQATITVQAPAASSQLQIIHNSADLAASPVDIYIDDILTLDSVLFRSATPFLTVDTAFNVKVTPNGAGIGSAIFDQNFTLQDGESYIAVASGIVSMMGYNPSPAFDVFPFTPASPTSGNVSEIDVLIFHGSTDAPTVTVNELTTGLNLEAGFSFGEYNDAGYLNLPDQDYILEVTDSAGVQLFYGAPLNTLGLAGSSIVVCASGFVDPSQNSNGAGFGLWVALPGGGPMVELPLLDAPRAQIIHNSADAAAEFVDIYLNGALTLDSVGYRTATEFIDLPNQFTIDISPNGAGIGSSVFNDNVTLLPGEKYIVVANGIASATGYSPAPALGLDVFAMGREQASTSTNTDVLVYHGSTDAPTVDVNETSVPAGNIVSQISYGEFTTDYLELGTQDYVLEVTDNAAVSVSYQAPLGTLGLDSQAIVVLASGFLDPSVNSNGPAFGLWTALASGGDLVELPVLTGLSNEAFNAQVSIYPNPAAEIIQVETGKLKATSIKIVDLLGREVKAFEANGQSNGQYNISDIKNGTYFIQIEAEGQVGALPLIIQ